MGRWESSDRRRRRTSHSSSHDPRALIQRGGDGQHWRSAEPHHSMMPLPPSPPPPPQSSAFQPHPSMAPYRRPTGAPVYEDDVGRYGYSRRRRSGREPSLSYEDRRRRRHRRPESPSSSDDIESQDDYLRRARGTTSREVETDSEDEVPAHRGRRVRRDRPIESSEESNMHGAGLRTPSTSSRDSADDHVAGPAHPVISHRYPTMTIEAPPAPTPARPRVSSEILHSRPPRSSRRHTRRSDPVIVQETIVRRLPSRSRSVRSSPHQHSSILSSLLSGSGGNRHPERPRKTKSKEKSVKLVECIICMSDVSSKKAPKLKCDHRMCHSCLKRNFELSLTDPQLMPPRCCTQDRISLRHVEPLFDNSFKRLWNRKYEEFTTQNRLYCPSKRCGEWIKPARIRREGNRKSAVCGHCKTKVCVACNGKWHSSFDCPKDEETQRFLKQAKEEGWQRCYSCKAMVERKQGCNHMTCRCGAQFCMLCGSKWKNCDCEWFNFEENDDLNGYYAERANPFGFYEGRDRYSDGEVPEPGMRGHPRIRTYGGEMRRRRLQEQRDEELARRMQYDISLERELADDDDDDEDDVKNDYDEGYTVGGSGTGSVAGLGIVSGHLANGDYRHSSRRNRARVRLTPSSTAAYDRGTEHRTTPRDPYDRGGFGTDGSHERAARSGSMEKRLADRLSENRQGIAPRLDMPMGYHHPSINQQGGVMPPAPPPPPLGPYPPAPMPVGMTPAGSPPMMAAPQHHPFASLPPHGPPLINHPPSMPVTDYTPVSGGARGTRRRDSNGSAPRSSSMAGLNARGNGLSRVSEWRNFVEPGVPDSDGARTSDEILSRVT